MEWDGELHCKRRYRGSMINEMDLNFTDRTYLQLSRSCDPMFIEVSWFMLRLMLIFKLQFLWICSLMGRFFQDLNGRGGEGQVTIQGSGAL